MKRARALAAFGLGAACAVSSCGDSGSGSAVDSGAATGSGSKPPEAIWFREVASARGLKFEHTSALEQRFHFPENMSGGVALLDYDGDGRLDVYFVQGGDLVEGPGGGENRLYRSDGIGFRDVTDEARVGDTGYGMGAACADYDGDGDTDLFVTNVGANVLYRNEGDGTFTDVTTAAGVGDLRWGASAAFLDFDADGVLDLFVVNYVDWSLEREAECFVTTRDGERDYCPPKIYGAPARDVLYRGRGDGTFEDVTAERGIDAAFGNGLGVVAADLTGDGRLDVYVANDGTANQLWVQTQEGRFEDQALLLGCALSGVGQAEAGMGVVACDLEADGDADLLLAHLRGETNTVYVQEQGLFDDRTAPLGLGSPTRRYTGFGLGAADFDQDGWLDVFVANGHVSVEEPVVVPTRPYAQPNQLFAGGADGRFREVAGAGMEAELVANSRAAAFGDLDGDGDVDVVVLNKGGPAHLLENVAARGGWIGFRVVDEKGRDALGAWVTVEAAGRRQARLAHPAYSIQASNDPRVHFGVGDAEQVDAVQVRWPDGSLESFGGRPVSAVHRLERGAGE